MPLFDGSTVSDGLSKPSNMSGVLGKPTLSYNGSYVMFDPRGRDGEGFSPHWSNSKATLVEGKNPMGHLPDAVGQNHIRQNFPLYANPSEVNSPTASADVRRQKPGCENLSPSFENSVYFARPQPVYRAAHCCNGPGCVMGPPYVVEHGSRMLNSLYEREWMQGGVPYTKMPPIQRQGPDTLLEQRGVPFEPTVDSLNRIHVEPYASNRVRALPVMMEPNFTRYHCAPTLNAPLSDHSHPLQTAPRGYPGLYSHRTYEHMTSELYQDPSSMAKYGQLAHHPVFYCPPANVDAEQRIQCKETSSKQGEDVPAIHKHSIPNSLEHCIVTQSLHGDIPLAFPSTEMLPVHPFMQGFSYPCYAVPRVHSNANQIRSPLKSQHTLPVYNYSLLNVSPSRQHKDHPRTSPTSPNKDKSTRDVGQVSSHSPFMYMNQTSPTRHIGQPGTSPSSIQLAKLFPTLAGLTVSPAVLSPVNMNLNRLTDYLPCQAPENCQKRPQSLPLSPSAWLSHTDQTRATPDGPKFQKVIFSPIVATESKHNGSVSFSGSSTHKDYLKRKRSNLSPPIKIKEDLYEGVIRKKLKKSNYQPVGNHTDSPPMPVIDNVFSLAHYLMASRGSSSGKALLRTTQSSDECEGKQENENKKSDPDEKQHNWAVTSKEICPHAPTEKVVDEDFEPLKVKVEKVDPSETDLVEETRINQSECIKVIIKMEPEDAVPPNSNPTNNCESEDLKSEPPSEITKDASVVSEPATFVTNQNSLSQGNVHHLHKPPVPSQADSNHPSPQPEPPKSPHKNPSNSLPYQNILSKDRQPSPCPPDRMPALALNVVVPQQVPQIPVRKHFFALHYSFCKQVSELVSASSEQELKNWLSQQEIGPVTSSTKVQKVTCLLGVKAREVWIKEEMKSKLNDILLRLKEYTAMERCPFPHIMRTGAVFLPMLVVKELLFPTVQGSLVDKVLQEHKVQLRPTTLSEEKILTQLHKRACSSKLRRLMSLRHLPDIYEDVVNLLYYTSVCKHLGVDYEDQDEDDNMSENWMSVVFSDVSSAASTSDFQPPLGDVKEQGDKPRANRSRTKSRVKSSSRRTFLDYSLSDEEEEEAGDAGKRNDVAQQESSLVLQSRAAEKSWTCPLSESDVETVDCVQPAESSSEPSRTKARSGVILRLRRMLGGLNRKSDCYQSVPVSGTFSDSSPLFQTIDDEEGSNGEQKTPTVTQRRQRVGNFSRTLKSLKRKHRAVLKIKSCPNRSSYHSGDQRRRWGRSSAVQRAHMALRLYYPELVGKRIQHLYEEDDKSEVWYRGEVLRVHKANANPLKTIFEVQYDSEPEWKYYLELLMDYTKGWLKIDD